MSSLLGAAVLARPQSRTIAVILNWNAWADTMLCAESVLASETVPQQIVICDNGSLDDSLERLTEWAESRGDYAFFSSPSDAFDSDAAGVPIVILAVGRNLGYAGGNNIGIRFAMERCSADFVWILNSDVIVAEDALHRMLDVAEADDEIAMVGSKLLRRHEPDTIQALGGGFIIPLLCHDTQLGAGKKAATAGTKPIRLDHIVGASLLVRAAAIDDVGLIDESYFLYREETDWCIRMRRDGWKLFCCTRAAVWHKQSHSIGFKSPLHDYYAVRNMLHLVRKFYPASLPAAFGYFAARSFLPKLARFEFARIVAVTDAFADFLMGVTGRSHRHSDRMLMSNYLPGHTQPVRRKLSTRFAAGAPAAIFSVLALIALAIGMGETYQSHHPHVGAIIAHNGIASSQQN